MSVRRSARVWPFLVLAVLLFRLANVNFCGVSSMSSRPCRIGTRAWFGRKSEQPVPNQESSNTDISDMDISAVSDWLNTLALDQYISHFQNASVDGLVLENLTNEDLQDMGVDRGVHRKKILAHRDALVAADSKKTSSEDLWKPETNDGTPDLEVQRFAQAVLKQMRKEGVPLEPEQKTFLKELDSLFVDKLKQRDLLNILEAGNDIVWSRTSHSDQAGGCIRDEVLEDQLQILEETDKLQQRIIAFSGNTQQLGGSFTSYARKVSKRKVTDLEKKTAQSQLEEQIQMWESNMKELTEEADICSENSLHRATDRLRLQLPGSSAVQANFDALAKLRDERQKVAAKCQRIYGLADPNVKIALEARNGALKDRIADVTWLHLVFLRRVLFRSTSFLSKKTVV